MNQTCNLFYFSWILVVSVCVAAPACSQDGLLKVNGQHIRLTTDLPADQANELIASFDAAVPQWEEFWQLRKGTLSQWTVQACVMRDKEAFRRQGLIPPRIPDFPFGYAAGNRIWAMAQESEYYTRHLLLHEGVHALAFSQFGGAGPSWFMEGTAELLSVHRGKGSDLLINQVPASRDEVPYWGRFKLMTDRREQSGIPSIEKVLNYPRDLNSDVESYGWSWAAAMLLQAYPEYDGAFFAAARDGRDSGPNFNVKLRRTLQSDWPVIAARWRLMCHDLDYGFDWAREKVAVSIRDRLWNGQPLTVTVAANQGWQSIGVRLRPGMRIKLTPSGQVTLADQPKPWISEPAGVTIRYHRGRPLGQLLAVIVPNVPPDSDTMAPLDVQAIVKPTALAIKEHCWLLFRVNDYVGELGDNRGAYTVQIDR